MAIRMMRDEAAYEAAVAAGDAASWEVVTNYPGHEAGRVRHSRECPYRGEAAYDRENGPECPTYPETSAWRPGEYECGIARPLYMKITHEGCVLSTGEYNGRDDSDFYAVVWSAEAGRPVEVTYASTRGWTYPNSAVVDPTPEVEAAYEAYRAKYAAEARVTRVEREVAELRALSAAASNEVRRGDKVRVFKGRKVPVGTEGVCMWAGMGNYGARVGIAVGGKKTADGKWAEVVWTAASNVKTECGEKDPRVEARVAEAEVRLAAATARLTELVAAPVWLTEVAA